MTPVVDVVVLLRSSQSCSFAAKFPGDLELLQMYFNLNTDKNICCVRPNMHNALCIRSLLSPLSNSGFNCFGLDPSETGDVMSPNGLSRRWKTLQSTHFQTSMETINKCSFWQVPFSWEFKENCTCLLRMVHLSYLAFLDLLYSTKLAINFSLAYILHWPCTTCKNIQWR